MRFAPRGRTPGEVMIGGSIFVLLVVCCVLLVRSGPWGILLSCVGLGLTAVAWAYTQIISGEWPGVGKLFTSRVCRRRNESAVQRHAREWGLLRGSGRKASPRGRAGERTRGAGRGASA